MILSIILAILATYRLALMLATEEGAFGVFVKIRERIDPTGKQETWLARGVNCPYCVGFWIALAFALLLVHQDATIHRSEFILIWFAIAGGQVLLQKWSE
jgi:hypothetical protein